MMENRNESTIDKKPQLSFAGISLNNEIFSSINELDKPFSDFEQTVIQKDKDKLRQLVDKYNKHTNDLGKIILIYKK